MSPRTPTTTSLRFSRAEANLIRPGLQRIVAAHAAWESQGRPPFSFDRLMHSAIRDDEGEFSPEELAVITRVLDKLADLPGKTKRVHLDAFELAACIFGARATAKMIPHRHIQGSFPNRKAAMPRLLAKLERHRKRAKRRVIRVQGHMAFTEASNRWQRFVLFVRCHFLYCSCRRPLLPGIHPRLRRRKLVETWMASFREELPAAGIKVPPDDELRELVKQALRSTDRFVRVHGLGIVRANRGLLRERIWRFVVNRCQEVSPNFNPIQRRSQDKENYHAKQTERQDHTAEDTRSTPLRSREGAAKAEDGLQATIRRLEALFSFDR